MRLAEFMLASLAIEIMPGPNMAWLAALAAAQGRRAGLFAVAGIAAGLAVYGIAAAVGLSALIAAMPRLFDVMQWTGIAYLLWLALDAWRTAAPRKVPLDAMPAILPGGMAALRQGFIINILNAKAGFFYIVMLPRFLDEKQTEMISANLLLAAVYVAIATVVHGAIALAASGFSSALPDGSSAGMYFRRTLAVVLLGVAIWLICESWR